MNKEITSFETIIMEALSAFGLNESESYNFDAHIATMISQGWQPYGNVYFTEAEDKHWIHLSMVKYKNQSS